ncbi:Hypothetical protein DHA2_150144, partial [Giardia duodenalis]
VLLLASGPSLPWGLLETGQEGGLLPLRASTPSADRRAMSLRQACRLCDCPCRITIVAVEAERGISSAPGEQVLSRAVWRHTQGPEGPSLGVQRAAPGMRRLGLRPPADRRPRAGAHER